MCMDAEAKGCDNAESGREAVGAAHPNPNQQTLTEVRMAPADRTTSSFSVLLCACCGSSSVVVRGWRTCSIAVLRCAACSHESPVAGFTVGRVYQGDQPAIIAEAIEDAALP